VKRQIAVIGPGDATAAEREMARALGEAIARTGAVLITGGRTGVMEAASAGAHAAGGLVVGVLPGESAREANPYVDVRIVTGMGSGRNVINVLSADLVIAVGGGPGTLSEIALALKHGVPVAGLASWEIVRDGAAPAGYQRLRSLEEAVAWISAPPRR
jgi:uncharacterized protein (TIGR00725 family)